MSQHQTTPNIYQYKQLLWFTLAIVLAITATIVISLALMSYMVKTQVATALAGQQAQTHVLPTATLTQASGDTETGPMCEPAPTVVTNNTPGTLAPASTGPVTNHWITNNTNSNSNVRTRSVNNNLTSTFFENSFNNSLNNTDSNNSGSNNTAGGDITQTDANNITNTSSTDVSGSGNNINGQAAPIVPLLSAPINPIIVPDEPLPVIE